MTPLVCTLVLEIHRAEDVGISKVHTAGVSRAFVKDLFFRVATCPSTPCQHRASVAENKILEGYRPHALEHAHDPNCLYVNAWVHVKGDNENNHPMAFC